MDHKDTLSFFLYKNVYFSCEGWIFLFFCRLKAENILVYILRLQSIVYVDHMSIASFKIIENYSSKQFITDKQN